MISSRLRFLFGEQRLLASSVVTQRFVCIFYLFPFAYFVFGTHDVWFTGSNEWKTLKRKCREMSRFVI